MPTKRTKVPTTAVLSTVEARRLAIAAQALDRARPTATIGRAHLRRAIDAVGVVQLDAINVVDRTQFLVLFSRLGAYDRARFHAMTGAHGELFEYWGHMASLQPVALHPLLRFRMAHNGAYGDSPTYSVRHKAWETANADYIAAVLDEVKEQGPLAASQLTDPRRRDGDWWARRGLGRQALEWLFAKGELAGWRSPTFERVYDLTERAIPATVLAVPTPSVEESHRQLLRLAAHSLGVATVADLADYHRIRPREAKPRVAELVEAGELVEVQVEGWRDPAYVVPGRRNASPTRRHATLLSPFDSLIWDRKRTARLFDFDFRIEVYVPEPKRTYGYYVLPLLLDDELVARFDLKADRKDGALLVRGSHLEPGADGKAVAAAAAEELGALAGWLGLDRVDVADRGDAALVRPLRRATR